MVSPSGQDGRKFRDAAAPSSATPGVGLKLRVETPIPQSDRSCHVTSRYDNDTTDTMNHASAERSIGFENDDCPFCDRTDDHEHQMHHIRRRELHDLLYGQIPLTYYPRHKGVRGH